MIYYGIAILLFLFLRRKRRISLSLAVAYIFLIVAATVLARTIDETKGSDWTPFRLFRREHWWTDRDLAAQIKANILMFIPVGLLLFPTAGWKSVPTGFFLSLVIELLQLLFRRGFSELDDVLFNTAGVLIGCCIYHFIAVYAGGQDQMYKRCVKRMLDILISLTVLIVLSPVYLLTALAIRLDSTGPVIFRQTRLGYHHKEFTLLKFRSMVVNAEHTGSGVYSDDHDARMTRVGKFIRRTCLDELPQMIKSLKGDMSLIGPRPPLTYHPWPLEQYTQEQLHMFDVRPGITGWAQINGRRTVEWHERIKLSNWYVDHYSFPLDVKIAVRTILDIFTGKNSENIGTTVAEGKKEQP